MPTTFIGVKGDGGSSLSLPVPAGLPRFGVVGTVSAQIGSGVQGVNPQGVGVEGTGITGVDGTGQTGIRGFSDHGTGILGGTHSGVGVHGSSDSGLAGKFDGNVDISGTLHIGRDITLIGDLFLSNTGKDLAEQFDLAPMVQYQSGMVMIIDENGLLTPCSVDYDRRAIGIVSGAGDCRPAITLGHKENADRTVNIALIGTAFCWADADKGSIEVGDLVTASSTLGHAMKATDLARSFGAVLGKALAPLRRGRGLVPVVVGLQ